ncbi:hypothetical protein D0B54_01425 [Solimonas sp. K1W22B-7]|uniref:hypothetical protein n=1 Tax=Solimonas sp. K1W22B-7 TaxID=2303331 RepID=UPI000E32F048|nr:hypothetical protein [Solimonas sp. K1W22B-7]AXQ27429.1 hypothetical protein D0B54_01425 [Solimonas sp. K1W22B-7]
MKLQHLLPTLLVLGLAACSNNDGDDGAPLGTDAAVISTRAPDYSSGAVSVAELATPFAAQNNLAATNSDIIVRGAGDHYFLVERGTGFVKRYSATAPGTQVYRYSTETAAEPGSNPHDIVVASPTKAYVLRYGSGKVWIVNPSAATEAAFKIGEIDLSAYDADGVPEMEDGLIKNGRLYIALQRLESFAAKKSGYVAVIDVATNLEINTGAGGATLKGIELPLRNPMRLVSNPANGDILVSSDGGYDNFAPLYEGGIARINTSTFATTLLVDDGTVAAHPRGQITDMDLVSGTRGYFIGSTGFGNDQTLYRFNPATSDAPVAVAGLGPVGLSAVSAAPDGNVWVGRTEGAAPGITVLGFAAGTETVVKARIDTVLTPMNIDFITVPTAP